MARNEVQLKLRFTEELRRRLAFLAHQNERSMNSEIVHALQQYARNSIPENDVAFRLWCALLSTGAAVTGGGDKETEEAPGIPRKVAVAAPAKQRPELEVPPKYRGRVVSGDWVKSVVAAREAPTAAVSGDGVVTIEGKQYRLVPEGSAALEKAPLVPPTLKVAADSVKPYYRVSVTEKTES